MKELERLRSRVREERDRLKHNAYLISFDWSDRPMEGMAVGTEWKEFFHDGKLLWKCRDVTPEGEDTLVQQFVLNAGTTIPPHRHPDADEVLFVASGRLELQTTKGDQSVSRYGTCFIESGTIHGGYYPVRSHVVMVLIPKK